MLVFVDFLGSPSRKKNKTLFRIYILYLYLLRLVFQLFLPACHFCCCCIFMFIFRYFTFKLHSSHARKTPQKKMRLKFPRISQFVIISKAVQSEVKRKKNKVVKTKPNLIVLDRSNRKGACKLVPKKKEDFTKL